MENETSKALMERLKNLTSVAEAISDDYQSYIAGGGNDNREEEQRERFFKHELGKHFEKLLIEVEASIALIKKLSE